MKRLIRNKKTRKYLQEDGTWGETERALNFDNMSYVIKAVQEGAFREVELVLALEDKPSPYDVILDLNPGPNSKRVSATPS